MKGGTKFRRKKATNNLQKYHQGTSVYATKVLRSTYMFGGRRADRGRSDGGAVQGRKSESQK